jgi:hypothetical protein
VVIESPELTCSVKFWVTICDCVGQESESVRTGVKLPATEGGPEMTPVVALMVSPVGSPGMVKVKGPIPPAICTVKL